jgi:hypothetical protein
LKPIGEIPEEKSIKTEGSSGPSGIPDAWSEAARAAAIKARQEGATGPKETSSRRQVGAKGIREWEQEKKSLPAGYGRDPWHKEDAAGQRDEAETKESDWPPIPKKPILGSTAPKPGRIKTAYGWAGKDMVGQRQTAHDRPPDKAVGTLRDYAAAAGAKR